MPLRGHPHPLGSTFEGFFQKNLKKPPKTPRTPFLGVFLVFLKKTRVKCHYTEFCGRSGFPKVFRPWERWEVKMSIDVDSLALGAVLSLLIQWAFASTAKLLHEKRHEKEKSAWEKKRRNALEACSPKVEEKLNFAKEAEEGDEKEHAKGYIECSALLHQAPSLGTFMAIVHEGVCQNPNIPPPFREGIGEFMRDAREHLLE